MHAVVGSVIAAARSSDLDVEVGGLVEGFRQRTERELAIIGKLALAVVMIQQERKRRSRTPFV